MRAFCELFERLDRSSGTLAKLEALKCYFEAVPSADAAWAAFLLAGGRPPRPVKTSVLREAALQVTQINPWLFEECYQAVGDLAETIAHVLPVSQTRTELSLSEWLVERILPMRVLSDSQALGQLQAIWRQTPNEQHLILNKLLTGGFRVGVSRGLVVRAIAQAFGLESTIVAQRFVGMTDKARLPSPQSFEQLTAPVDAHSPNCLDRPFPFFLAHSIADSPESLGPIEHWQIEWKWDGIRGQLVNPSSLSSTSTPSLWSRGEELLTESFPELLAIAERLPQGTILDGEILVWDELQNRPKGFQDLQQRITRKRLTTAMLRDNPATFMAYDLLAFKGNDCRVQTLSMRRQQLTELIDELHRSNTLDAIRLQISPILLAKDWQNVSEQRAHARQQGVEGLMLKRLNSTYGVGRTRGSMGGDWFKWKLDPYRIDAVLIYAQAGHGRRASLYTDYTFAVWDDQDPQQEAGERRLVPFAKAYSGLTDAEIRQVDALIKKTTIDKFGPVRSVTPTLVFELGFEGIQASSRHKSGIAVRFPRILRWRQDKPINEADTLSSLQALL